MLDIATLRFGDRVHYIDPHSKEYQNGKVKEIPEHTDKAVRVVYKCGGNWGSFENYTSELTPIENLHLGWK